MGERVVSFICVHLRNLRFISPR